MPTSEECEQKAAECLRLARVMNDVTHQALLLKMALAWIERANQIKTSYARSAEGALIEQERSVHHRQRP